MATVLKTEFYFGNFRVYVGDDQSEELGTKIIDQPFVPDGSGAAWANEAEALAWWDTIKDTYRFHIDPPVTPEIFIEPAEEEPANG